MSIERDKTTPTMSDRRGGNHRDGDDGRGLHTIFSGETTSLPTLRTFHTSDCDISQGETIPWGCSSTEADEVGSNSGSATSEETSLSALRRRLRELDSEDEDDRANGIDKTNSNSSSSTGSPWIDVSDSSSMDEEDTVNDLSSVDERQLEAARNRHRSRNRKRPSTSRRQTKDNKPSKTVSSNNKRNSQQCPKPEQKLKHVQYLSRIDIASTNKDISTVEPIGEQEAREAFHPRVPRFIKKHEQSDDEISSIGGTKRNQYHPRHTYHRDDFDDSDISPPISLRQLERVDEEMQMVDIVIDEQEGQDVANLRMAPRTIKNKHRPKLSMKSAEGYDCWLLGYRSRTEVLLIAFIVLSVFILIILVGVVVRRK